MPYFVYQIKPAISKLVKNMEKLEEFEAYKEAKNLVKDKRKQLSSEDETIYKIIFADNELQAEEQLMEKREAPIVLEWEK
ncbi:hypothetical protein MNBD_GAMMA24-2439 [hydrothermal vent metagenome]|uniref:Uncharacterized protein n=1 Tax=hydrothermal vent metagenome TaxID=652676 RepID=A0A3B1BJF5_9ZZZZ